MAETWLLKETLSGAEMYDSSIKFTADNRPFKSLHWSQSTLTSMTDDDNLDTIYFYRNGAFTDPALRTIIFETSPTGDSLTWLQANGTKIITIETGTYVFKDIPDTVSVQFSQGIDINFKVKGSTYSWNKILVDANSRYGVCYFTSENPGWNVGYVDIHATAQSNYVWGCYDSSVEDMDGDPDADTKTITIETAQNVPENFATWFNSNTTKQTGPRKSYDLSTSAKWATLTAGNHNVQIVAKANGYRDSEPSAAVTVNKPAATVTLSKGTYKFVSQPTAVSSVIQQDIVCTAAADTYSYTLNQIQVNTSTASTRVQLVSTVDVMVNSKVSGSSNYAWYNYNDGDTNLLSTPPTITIASDVQVSADFYKWAITDGNLVKQVQPTGETWVINESPNVDYFDFNISFTSNNQRFNRFYSQSMPSGRELLYNDNIAYGFNPMTESFYWTNEAYRTVTFDEPPTGELFTWLQANGNKQ